MAETAAQTPATTEQSASVRVYEGAWTPLWMLRNEVKLISDLPGLTGHDIDVQVTDSPLTISGKKKEETEDGDEEDERSAFERHFGSFMRRIFLPEGIDQDKIDASFINGVLMVPLPKKPEAQHRARKIEVKAAT
ncbi:Hsp20/alpha crystallin family protein [Roseovarius sp.]|uniref:Hsp20/alpha crystallin family protein n=1 Tax=Roseovarius sp. TaxID=1486281 RepID=UPI00356457AD